MIIFASKNRVRILQNTRRFYYRMQRNCLTFVIQREKNFINRYRLIIFIYTSIIILIGVTINFCGLSGPQDSFYTITNCCQCLLAILFYLLWYFRRIKLSFASSALYIVGQLEISTEMIKCAIEQNTYSISLIIGNTALSAGIIMLTVISSFRLLPYFIASLSMLSFGICILITRDDSLKNFFLIFLFVFFFLSMLGHRQITIFNRLTRDRKRQKKNAKKELNLFAFNKSQLMAYITLAKEKGLSIQQTQTLLDNMGEKAKKNIYDNVSDHIRQSQIDYNLLGRKLPELSPSELQICELILKNMKIKEISKKLNKSESNITCQRTNIRSKLGLQKGDDLPEALHKRMKSRWIENLHKFLFNVFDSNTKP